MNVKLCLNLMASALSKDKTEPVRIRYDQNMANNFRSYIHKVLLDLDVYLFVFAKRMNLTRVSQRLESHISKVILQDGRDKYDLVVLSSHHDAVTIISNGGPLYSLGCPSTAAADILKTDEESDFPNIVSGDLPPDGSEGVFIDDLGVSYNIKSLIATRRSMEYLWHYYQSQDADPGPSGQDPSIGHVAPPMRSPLYDLDDFDLDGNPDHNFDGDTRFFTEGSNKSL